MTAKYSIPCNRSVREVWELLMNLHGLEYHMHDYNNIYNTIYNTLVVALPETLARLQPAQRAPEIVDVFYTPSGAADVAPAFITQRFDVTATAFPQPQRPPRHRHPERSGEGRRLPPAPRGEQSIPCPSEALEQGQAEAQGQALGDSSSQAERQAATPGPAAEERAVGQTSTTDPNSLEIYDLGSDNAGFLAIIAQKLPEVSALALDDAGLVAGTATAAVHDEIAT